MTDQETHIAAICARPDLDLPRLVYADWLEGTAGMVKCLLCVDGWIGCVFRDADGERSRTSKARCDTCHGAGEVSNGHTERASFIRVQIELARDFPNYGNEPVTQHYYNVRAVALRRREQELDRHYENWLPSGTGLKLHALRGAERAISVEDESCFCRFRRGFVEEVTCSWFDFRRNGMAIRKATPLKKVRLMTRPEWYGHHWNAAITDEWLKRDYPGLEFELPPPEATTNNHEPN